MATASITGSILGNTLLVLGASFFIGGLKNGLQSFNQRVAGMNASMLALAVIGLGIPTLFGHVAEHADVQAVSDITAGILLTLYVLMLVFYFRTPEVAHVSGHEPIGPHWPGRLAMLVLLLSTASVAVISDVFVGTLDAVISDIGISAVFLGLIIVPLVGNIAENIVGIKIAYQNDMDFSMLVSLGSSLQIALGVAPAAGVHLAADAAPLRPAVPGDPGGVAGGRRLHHRADRCGRRVELAGGRAADGGLRDHRNGGVVPVTRSRQMAFAAIFGVAALALGMQVAGVEGQLVFVVAGVGVAGLAWALGEATEQAGGTAGPRVSALLNASFGNLPELVILVLAINAGLADIARASIIGSVIGNVLLILGLALLLGGWRHGIQRFNERMAARTPRC